MSDARMVGGGGGDGEAVEQQLPALPLAAQDGHGAAAAAGTAPSGVVGADIVAAFASAPSLSLPPMPAPEPAGASAVLPPAIAPESFAAAPGRVRLKVTGAAVVQPQQSQLPASAEQMQQQQHGAQPAALLPTQEAPPVEPPAFPTAAVQAFPLPAQQAAAPAAKPFKLKLKVKPVQPPPPQ